MQTCEFTPYSQQRKPQPGYLSPIDKLLPLLDRVRQVRPGRWVAACPGPMHEHGDRHPSLRVDEKPDGGLLLHCDVCQDNDAIRRALGIEWHELYPPREPALQRERDDRPRNRLDSATGLRLVSKEVDMAALLILVASKSDLTPDRRCRLFEAADSVRKTMRACGLRDFS